MAISSSQFIEDTVLFLRNKLRSSITDPLTGRTEGFVMTSYPKRDVQYPIITVKQTNISTRKLGMVSETHYATLTLEVRVWARNAKECDELSSDVIDYLRDLQYSPNGTDNEELFGFSLTSANPIVEDAGDKTIHSKVLTFEYKCILN